MNDPLFIIWLSRSYPKEGVAKLYTHVSKRFTRVELIADCAANDAIKRFQELNETFELNIRFVKCVWSTLSSIESLTQQTILIVRSEVNFKEYLSQIEKLACNSILFDYNFGFGGLRPIFKERLSQRYFPVNDTLPFTVNFDHVSVKRDIDFSPFYGWRHTVSKFGSDLTDWYGFRVRDKIARFRNSAEKPKVIMITGGSAIYGYSSWVGHRATDYLEDMLIQTYHKDFICFNYAYEGHTILNEITSFILFSPIIKPDIVISFSGYNDLQCGSVIDPQFVNQAIVYQDWLEREVLGSEGPSSRNGFPRSICEDVVAAFESRVLQYKSIVEGCNTKFLHVLQPLAIDKFQLSADEQRYQRQSHEDANAPSWKMNSLDATRIGYMFDKFRTKLDTTTSFDLGILFKKFGAECSLFSDSNHFTAEGEKVVANELLGCLRAVVG